MKKLSRIAFVAALAAAGFALHSPAQAATAQTVVFAGTATTPPLGYPVNANGVNPGGGGAFRLVTDIACADAGTQATGASCNIDVSGTVGAGTLGGAWCGHSAGAASGVYTDSSGNDHAVSITFSTAGGLVEFSGTAGGAPIRGAANATPTGGSCATGTATGFTVAGAAILATAP